MNLDKLQYISTQYSLKSKPENNMQVKSTKNNYFTKSSEIPKSIKIFFLILHLAFGQDFGFGNLFGKKTAKLFKYYSTVLALTIFILIMWPLKLLGHKVWYWCTLAKCVLCFGILKTTKYTVFNLLSDIHNGERISVLEKEAFGVIASTYASVMFIANLLATAAHFIFNPIAQFSMFRAIFTVCCHTVDLMPDAQIFIRFYIYAYVKNIGQSLKQDQNINKFIEKYDKIADCQDKIRRLCDYFTLVQLFVNIPNLLESTWFMLSNIKTEANWFITTAMWMFAFHPVIQIVIPAVITQLVQYVIDDIRQSLNKRGMIEKDPRKNAEIVRVMKYLKVRRMQYRIWGLLPTDLRLSLALINICTTYLIVIIQFTHLYD